MDKCIVCNHSLQQGSYQWLYHCPECMLDTSLLDDPEFNKGEIIGWDQTSEEFLEKLRLNNSKVIFETLSSSCQLKNKTLLDVGCASGWFLRVAKSYNIDARGIEPDSYMAKKALDHGFKITNGFFPDALVKSETFDIISFNDVFEHLKNPDAILAECNKRLNKQGFLILTLPSSNGFFYKIAKLMSRFGFNNNLNRLWQKGYESPHLYYFNNSNLERLAKRHNYQLIKSSTLPSIDIKGLYERLNEGKNKFFLILWMEYISILILYPLIRYIFPSDIIFHIYQTNK